MPARRPASARSGSPSRIASNGVPRIYKRGSGDQGDLRGDHQGRQVILRKRQGLTSPARGPMVMEGWCCHAQDVFKRSDTWLAPCSSR
eukprot:8499252-Pyramimonas_sp.AAC.1